jgi:hypothetical protein
VLSFYIIFMNQSTGTSWYQKTKLESIVYCNLEYEFSPEHGQGYKVSYFYHQKCKQSIMIYITFEKYEVYYWNKNVKYCLPTVWSSPSPFVFPDSWHWAKAMLKDEIFSQKFLKKLVANSICSFCFFGGQKHSRSVCTLMCKKGWEISRDSQAFHPFLGW